MSEAPPRGNFIAGQNRGKPQGSRQPDFTGRMSIPGRDNEHGVALWVRKDKHLEEVPRDNQGETQRQSG